MWAQDQVIEEVRLNQQPDCPYNDLSEEVSDLSSSTLGGLTKLQNVGRHCGDVSQNANLVQTSLKNYFDSMKNDYGISHDSGKGFVGVTCKNYILIYENEYTNALSDLQTSGHIPDGNYFASQCESLKEESEEPSEGYYICLQDALAKRMRKTEDICQSKGLGKSSVTMAAEMRNHFYMQQETLNTVQQSMRNIHHALMSENCDSSEAITKVMVQSLVSMSTIAAMTTLGPGPGLGIAFGGEIVTMALDYLSKLSLSNTKLDEIQADEAYQDAACMFINVVQQDCKERFYNKDIPSCYDKKLREERRPAADWLSSVQSTIPQRQYRGRAYYDMAKDLVGVLEKKIDIPAGKSDSVVGYLRGLARRVRSAKDPIGLLKQLQDSYAKEKYRYDAEEVYYLLETIDQLKKVTSESPSEDQYGKLKDILQKLNKMRFVTHLQQAIKMTVQGESGLSKIASLELAAEMTEQIKETYQSFSGDLSMISALTSSMVETFRDKFKSRLRHRYIGNLQDAYKSEKSQDTDESLKGARSNTFKRLRDIIKDCLATSGMHYYHYDTRNPLFTWLWGPPLSADLNVRIPNSYLQACQPFFCEEGIPLPRFHGKKDSMPSEYSKYQCQVLANSQRIFEKMHQTYIDKGTICGKSISDITQGGSSFSPSANETRLLKHIIRN